MYFVQKRKLNLSVLEKCSPETSFVAIRRIYILLSLLRKAEKFASENMSILAVHSNSTAV